MSRLCISGLVDIFQDVLSFSACLTACRAKFLASEARTFGFRVWIFSENFRILISRCAIVSILGQHENAEIRIKIVKRDEIFLEKVINHFDFSITGSDSYV